MADVRLVFDNPTEEQSKHIFNAQDELGKADIAFDSGFDVSDGKIISRVWELDYSLKGARVVEIKAKASTMLVCPFCYSKKMYKRDIYHYGNTIRQRWHCTDCGGITAFPLDHKPKRKPREYKQEIK